MEEHNLYYQTVKKELAAWEAQMLRRPGLANRASKALQAKVHGLVPQRVQNMITASVKTMLEVVLSGSSLLTKTKVMQTPTLAESDFLVERAYSTYHNVAVAQGISFGLGGVLINLADLPALLSIKTKFLFDCGKLYGFDVDRQSERLFMLYVFQLAFSSDQRRREIFPIVKHWDDHAPYASMNWEALQIEYRDYLDIAKLLQLLPVVGAVAGGTANHNLIKKLKVTAMNAYRMRVISRGPQARQDAKPH